MQLTTFGAEDNPVKVPISAVVQGAMIEDDGRGVAMPAIVLELVSVSAASDEEKDFFSMTPLQAEALINAMTSALVTVRGHLS